MIAGDGDDGRGIETIGFEELIVVVRRFAEVVDDIAEVEEERRYIGRIGFGEVGDHLVGDKRLRSWPLDAAGVTDGVEDDLAGLLDGRCFSRPLRAVYLRECECGFDRVTGGKGNGLDGVKSGVLLVGDRILESVWIR